MQILISFMLIKAAMSMQLRAGPPSTSENIMIGLILFGAIFFVFVLPAILVIRCLCCSKPRHAAVAQEEDSLDEEAPLVR
jgi:hypothetical protein